MLYYDNETNIHLFETEEEQLEKYREYGYISSEAKNLKVLYYKMDKFSYEPCQVIGYFIPGNKKHLETCVVIEVAGRKGLVHKSFLKEMQEMKRKFDLTTPTMVPLFKI